MICPSCKNEARIPPRATFNGDQYGTISNTVTECCGAIVRLIPIRAWRIEATDALEDDWGYSAQEVGA